MEKAYILNLNNLELLRGIKLSEEPLNVRVEFKGETLQRFEAVKKYYGLEDNTEVLRILVNEKFKEVFGSKEA